MEKRTKRALLYSALVCPGIGHWQLGRRGRAVGLVVAFSALIGLFLYRLIMTMIRMYNELMEIFAATGEVLPDVDSINEMHLSIYIDNWWLILAILAVWGFGVWDIYPRKKAG